MADRRFGRACAATLATLAIVPWLASPAQARKPQPPPASSGAPIVIIWDENKTAAGLLGNSSAPYLNSLVPKGTFFSQYVGVAHPSLPNYLAFASGSTEGKVGTDKVTAGEIHSPSVWDQLTSAGVSWRVYEELMPSTCYAKRVFTANNDQYALRHNPATPYAPVFTSAECQHVVPFSQFDAASLPAVSFVTPSICNDMHGSKATWAPADCVPGTQALIQRGDTWLSRFVPAMLSAGAKVFITFDEGQGALYAVEVGPGVPAGATDATRYNHYSLLAGIEDVFGLAHLGGAATATPIRL
jgi:phospholipase C